MSTTSGLAVVVIGGGVAGLSTALHLRMLGVRGVSLLEAGDIAGGSSGLSVGIIETQYLEPLDVELRVRSMEFFDALEDQGLEIVRNGYLRTCRSSEEIDAAHRSVETQQQFGVTAVRVLSPDQILELIPHLNVDGIAAGLFGSRDGYLDGHLYATQLADMARELGVRIVTSSPVVGLEQGSRKPLRVVASSETFECDYVVNAAGAWASHVGEILGAPVEVIPQRHQVAFVQLPEPLPYLMPSVMDYTPHSGGYGLYLRDEGPGRLVAGLHTEELVHEAADPDSYERSLDQSFIDLVAEKLYERLPLLDGAALSGGWAGLYPVSPDGYALVGPHPDDDRVIVACGLGGFGIQVSPVIGRLVAEWIVHGEPKLVSEADKLLPARQRVPGETGWRAAKVPRDPTTDIER